jgi:HTH-type transcriptional regulator/antitoxin HigA
MAVKSAATRLPDAYFALVRDFPLTSIRDDDHLAEAQGVIDRLLRLGPDAGGDAYLDALTDLVETYEAAHAAFPDVSGSDVLRELMRANGLSQNRLAKAVGISQSTISAVLNGRRTLTMDHIIALAGHFGVRPSAFLPA